MVPCADGVVSVIPISVSSFPVIPGLTRDPAMLPALGLKGSGTPGQARGDGTHNGVSLRP